MTQDRLYLLKAGFIDQGKGPYFCPECAQMVGLLEFYPALKQRLEVRWLNFPRPRPELIDLLGEENQNCPVLVLKEAPKGLPSKLGLIERSVHAPRQLSSRFPAILMGVDRKSVV